MEVITCLDCKKRTDTVIDYRSGDTICTECGPNTSSAQTFSRTLALKTKPPPQAPGSHHHLAPFSMIYHVFEADNGVSWRYLSGCISRGARGSANPSLYHENLCRGITTSFSAILIQDSVSSKLEDGLHVFGLAHQPTKPHSVITLVFSFKFGKRLHIISKRGFD
ncbi:Zinc finger TFIIB-type [Arabidopsis suecica]|uniref:Zinc finger TFIIB-type n=1 Tax=Arabidopsis suecica TaxID=45249 RepID=A0A8T1YQG9_ARASU|nr:Zinc finger TFIIB-type [Arabidopsis suecica]